MTDLGDRMLRSCEGLAAADLVRGVLRRMRPHEFCRACLVRVALLRHFFDISPILMKCRQAGVPHSAKINHASWATTFASHPNTLVAFKSQKITKMLSSGSFSEKVF